MAVKNATTKVWALTPSFDGLKYSAWPGGDKPTGYQAMAKLVGTNRIGVTLVNNVNGSATGSYFAVLGYVLGTKTNMGTAAGARVYCRDPLGDNTWYEVAAYVGLGKSRTWQWNQLLRLEVQIGTLGGSQVAGRALDVKVVVNGTTSNILTGALVNQGARDFYYASPTGNDATGVKNDPTRPFRYIQNASGGTYLGIWALWKPGDETIIRGNAGTWTDQLAACNGRWAQFPWGPAFPVTTGADPLGGGGAVGKGYYTFYGMPGEDVHATFNNGGGIQGCDSARAQAGSGQFVQVANLRMDTQGGSARDAGMINFQSGANGWVARDNECGPWIAGSSSFLNSSGIGGQCSNTSVQFNYIHDIESLADQQNHCAYFGGVSGGTGYDNCTFNTDFSYNVCINAGGSTLQFYWQGGNGKYFTGITAHHNYLQGAGKYGINAGESLISGQFWNNVIVSPGWSALRVCPPSGQTPAIYFEHNTVYGWNHSAGATTAAAAILQEGFVTTGAVKFNHNIFRAAARAGAYSIGWYTNNGAGDSNVSASQNVYFDPDGVVTAGWSIDAAAIVGDPKFTSIAGFDFTCQTGGAGIDATTTAEAITVSDDFYGIARPQGAHNDIGACEGVGT